VGTKVTKDTKGTKDSKEAFGGRLAGAAARFVTLVS